MNSLLSQLHGSSTAFPPSVTAVRLAIALAIGLLIGFERQWSHKDFGVRTFTLTSLLGALTAVISAPAMLMGMAATILLAVLLNVRDIITSKTVEGREVDSAPKELELHLASPVSLKKVFNFGVLFLTIQVIGTLAVRWLGNTGVLLVSIIGGTVSRASTTAAAANLTIHGNISALQAGTATVLTSIASTGMNLPIVRRQIKDRAVVREITLATGLQAVVGVTVLFVERWFVR